MFGHDDDEKDENQHDGAVIGAADNDNAGWQHPGPPPTDDNNNDQNGATEDFTAGHVDQPVSEPDGEQGHSDDNPAPLHALPASDDSDDFGTPARSSDDLIDLKQEALGKLSPLIGHLDQSPDEKFRTLMMMIQASDEQSLVRQAYETALQIDDEKSRAQALLDIVNEINYFTQNAKSE